LVADPEPQFVVVGRGGTLYIGKALFVKSEEYGVRSVKTSKQNP
jgi:hypothetical protein